MENRVIKFKAWDINDKKFLHSNTLSNLDKVPVDSEADTFSFRNNKFVTYCQFSGLLDKNGKEIYEGDIAEREGHLYSIEFSYGCFYMRINGNREMCTMEMIEFFNKSRIIGHFHKQLTVIGNIFENPELLK